VLVAGPLAGLAGRRLASMALRSRLREGLATAIKARDQLRVRVLRTTLAAIENDEAVDVPSTGPGAATSEHVAGASPGVGAVLSPYLPDRST
jgi:hypothetical protein